MYTLWGREERRGDPGLQSPLDPHCWPQEEPGQTHADGPGQAKALRFAQAAAQTSSFWSNKAIVKSQVLLGPAHPILSCSSLDPP